MCKRETDDKLSSMGHHIWAAMYELPYMGRHIIRATIYGPSSMNCHVWTVIYGLHIHQSLYMYSMHTQLAMEGVKKI